MTNGFFNRFNIVVVVLIAFALALSLSGCPKPQSGSDTIGTGIPAADGGASTSGTATGSGSGTAGKDVEKGHESESGDTTVESGMDKYFPDEGGEKGEEKKPVKKEWKPLKFSSPVFGNNEAIPVKYTADGEDISPPLAISGVPSEAATLVIIVDDPDAPGAVWDHWVLFNIPKDVTTIPEGSTPGGAKKGRNSWGGNGYGGPNPPSGTHRYRFRLYTVDNIIGLDAGATKAEVMQAIEGHIVAKAEFIGTYGR